VSAVAELARTATLIPRWPFHGDLHIEIRDDRIYLAVVDVEALAGIPPWAHGETLIGEDWTELGGQPYYLLHDAVARCEAEETTRAGEFLTWLDVTLRELLADDVLDQAQHVPGFFGSYPVRRAAELLRNDPAISIGQNTLFAHMAHQGWIERPTGDWTITTHAHRNGWLTIRDVTIPAATKDRRRSYPQIYITPEGLDELRRTLYALNPAAPVIPPQPSLFD
jgi:hypothetical protein